MRVTAIVAVLLLAAVNVAGLLPAAATVRPYLPAVSVALAIVALALLLLQLRPKAAPPGPAVEPARPAAPPAKASRADAEIVAFLAMLQEKGRLVDFLMDDINAYNDSQVGAAARVVHAGCSRVLKEHFAVQPVRTEPEGSTITVPAGFSATEYRLVGRISGQAPFSGVLVHRGWRTAAVQLPRLLAGAESALPAIAPAEVELK
ncbi:MAG TPA: DUF2760 domain-containing protein [Acetobacteraceae bacterium]|nr:DUF2760 domain-containing protein [Acetobacteraceae bacterium]